LCLDILIRILSHTDPRDIFCLRMCCRSLHEASVQRIVWTDAVRRIPCRSTWSLSSFQTDKMTLVELQHVATSACRFMSHIRRSLSAGHKLMPPIATRLLNLDVPWLDPSDIGRDMLRLVPGGRFLITTKAKSVVELWDLGYTPTTLIPLYPLATM
ncbi:hypothetical protein JAAARDRAFT_106977, partial [Jaapia argillacea MUCL 33604]